MNHPAPSRHQRAPLLAAMTLLGAVFSAAVIVLGAEGSRPELDLAFADLLPATAIAR
ncbi:hypothetical protein HHL11_31320 [Ramlibacter sp. G-1-2-2]|uniref:Iron ABC transporter permease n=1 Tax=Ramlibacter agri TaxID=2728837 RepID=A0A848HG22_9BURK|nr:hypothetical protein [Ramlibacter agri]NML48281.1 hypothetical protein [Ramlibacter agri]